MTTIEAVGHLVVFARQDASSDTVEAIGLVLDHIRSLEHALELIQDGVESALRNRPENAVSRPRRIA